MKHKLLIAAAVSALMAAPSLASAQDTHNSDAEGWYLKGAAGYGSGTDLDITDGMLGDAEAEGNGAFNLGLGYDFGENWRVEVDGTSMWNDYGAIDQAPSSFAKLRTDALMLNAIYDFSDFDRWAPYIGAGIGVVRGDASLAAHDFPNIDAIGQIVNPACAGSRGAASGVAGFSCDVDDKDAGFGWQLLAGLGYAITDNLTWDTNYRYMQASDMKFDGRFTNVQTGSSSANSVDIEGIGAHQILTGLRYRFGGSRAPVEKKMVETPPPPTPDYKCWDDSMVFNAGQCPAEPQPDPEVRCWDGTMVFEAAQCPAEPVMVECPDGSLVSDINFCAATDTTVTLGDLCGEQYRQEIIYYEFDKGASAETRNTISRILDAGQYCDVQNIRVVGHTDTSGAASYNLALSKRRATDALNELVRQGISRNVITAEGKGETEPFVDTGDGVKEQLNRRTEVLITLGSVGVIN